MTDLQQTIQSGARFPRTNKTMEVIEIGNPGNPKELFVYNGRIWVYNQTSQALIDGGYITAEAFETLILTASKLTSGAQKYIENINWTSDDEDTCSWSAGTITFHSGRQINVISGNTGNLTTTNYIYFDGTSTLKKTEYANIAQGSTKIPLAIVTPVTVGTGRCIIAPVIPRGTSINGDVITTGRISSTNEKTYFDLEDGTIMVNDNNDDRVLIGKIGASYGIKVSLPGYDVDTETDLDHFALWSVASDTNDSVLIKEKVRGSVSVSSSTTENIAHGLAYIPFTLVFVESSPGIYVKCYGQPIGAWGFYFDIDATNLHLRNYSGSTKTFKYYIFYDQMS